ncbi:MAG: hypothetical protein II336_10360 [Loktanella sp.]|nr:hypothetical protein [Loktanella sp.]
MTQRDFSVAFHIGAHKTATSHLQRSFQAHAAALDALGICYLGPDHLRQPGRSVAALFGLKPGSAGLSGEVAALRQTRQRLILSEENYIGALIGPRGKPMIQRYPDAGPRVHAVAQALGQKIDVFLTIRRPTAFLNSAYCQQLMGGRVVRMAKFRQDNPTGAVDWGDLVARLRAMPGIGELVVWCYEDYAAHFAKICARLLGPEAAALVAPLDERIHSSLSAAAVAEVLHRHALREIGDLGLAARRLLPVEAGFPPFDGFRPAEHAASDAVYLDQIAAIAAMPGVTLLQPVWAAAAMRA